MTPQWLKGNASYINKNHSMTDQQVTFNAGSLGNVVLLKIPLMAAGFLSDETPLTVQITVANDVSIGQNEDSDPRYRLSDGTNFIGFQTFDRHNYHSWAPCFGTEASPGGTLSASKSISPNLPILSVSERFYPEQFVFTLKLDKLWGSCFTAQDGGFTKTAEYSKRLKLSQGLTLEVYKGNHKKERVGIKYMKVIIMKTGD